MADERYRKIIENIHSRQGERFSAADIHKAAPGRRATLYLILNRLRHLGYIDRIPKAFEAKVWFATPRLAEEGIDKVVESYQLYMTVRLSVKEMK